LVEFGPGRVLGGMLARIDKSVEVHQVEDVASLEATAAALML
jgi:malonyl CoA-acyl carrier protein transacylase